MERPSTPKILVIGWEDAIRRRIAWILREDGFEPHEARSLSEALTLAKSEQPEVIVINTDWPEEVKEDQIDALQRVVPDTPIIDVTKRAVNPRYNTDADAYLAKPFHAMDLVEKIERLMRGEGEERTG
jgi:DNA-binding response OmpR family regulator